MFTVTAGRASDFLEFVAQNNAAIYKYAKNLCRDEDLADELVQEATLECYEAINKKGYVQNDFSLYIFARIKWVFCKKKRSKNISLPLSDHLHVADSEHCNNKVDALALQIDVYITSHYEPRHVGWWQMHLQGATYEEIAFLDNVQAPRICKVIQKIKAEVRENFKARVQNLVKD